METNKDLEYVNNLLEESEPNGYPTIYALWGVIVLIGFVVTDIKPEWATIYWVASNVIGITLSILLGRRADTKMGQQNRELGKRYAIHFGIMGACIFIAMFSKDYQAILLIVGLGYCLAGLYLERIMFLVGIVAVACYIGVVLGIITSNIVLGVVFASGLFATAWATSSKNVKN